MKHWRVAVLFALILSLSFAIGFDVTNHVRSTIVHAQGPGVATLTGTGACATITTQGGGAFSGTLKCTGTTGASTITITPSFSAQNGFECHGSDTTTAAVANQAAPVATGSCKLNFASVTANDVITFGMTQF